MTFGFLKCSSCVITNLVTYMPLERLTRFARYAESKNILSELNQAQKDVKCRCALGGAFLKSVTVNLMFLTCF